MEDERTEYLKPLADLILEKTGILRSTYLICHLIEERIAQNHTNLNVIERDEDSDDEEDPSKAWYGGATYDEFFVIKDGIFYTDLEDEFSEEEKKLLSKFSNEHGFIIFVKRSDTSGQDWRITLSIPFSINAEDSDHFDLILSISRLTDNRSRQIEAYTLDETLTKERASKILTMYSLQL
jgi:hypothetical protein